MGVQGEVLMEYTRKDLVSLAIGGVRGYDS